MTVLDRVDTLIAAQRLLDHPFYVAWSRGELTREALRRYAEQYYHWVAAFPTFLSATHANCASLETRRQILENLNDEERGPDNHPELWLRFCDALGLDREAVTHTELLPETREAIDAYARLSRTAAPAASLGALYAYESQQPAVMRTKREGLENLYGVTTGHEYFTLHETLDVRHSRTERNLLAAEASRPGTDDAAVCDAVRDGLNATYRLLDGVHRQYVAAGSCIG